MPILAIVPPCAGECRLVRVTGVLIFANSRTVLLVCCPQQARPAIAPAPATGPAAWPGARRRAAATTHQPVGRPAAPGAIAGMTYRDEQSVRPTAQTTLPNIYGCRLGCHLEHLHADAPVLCGLSEARIVLRAGRGEGLPLWSRWIC